MPNLPLHGVARIVPMQEVYRDSSTSRGSIMGSKIFMTYKRKRLFSRSGPSNLHLHSDTHPEISVSKSSANFNEHEKQISEHICQNKESDAGICHDCYLRNIAENMLQCENYDSLHQGHCSDQHVQKLPRLYSAGLKQQHLLVSKFNSPEQKRRSQNSDGNQRTVHPTKTMEGDSGETHRLDSLAQLNVEEKSAEGQSKPILEKSGTEYKCKEKVPISLPPDACSVMELDVLSSKTSDGIHCSQRLDTCISRSTLEEASKLNKDPHSLCNDSVKNCKFNTALMTYQRRSKRERNIAALNVASEYPVTTCASELQFSGSNLMSLEDEKKPPEVINKLHTSPVPAPESARAVQMDDLLHIPQGMGKNTSAVTESPQDPLFAAASRDIDCNLPIVSGFDENHLPGASGVLPDARGLTSKRNQNIQTEQAQCRESDPPVMAAVGDKGKSVVNSPPMLASISSQTKYLQLFPENISSNAPQLANDQENSRLNGQACYYPPYPWPNVQAHPREAFHDFLMSAPDQAQSFSRQKMMLDNIFTRARAAQGNRSVLLDTFRPPTLWLEEELDCLWIGVRRHGRGNWEAILRDRRLLFSPWKMPCDLAEKWQEEQSRLFHTKPIPQVIRYVNSFPSNHANILLHPQANGGRMDEVRLSLGNGYAQHDYCARRVPSRHLFHSMKMQRTRRPQELVRTSSPLSSYGYFHPSECNPDESLLRKGSLPHWLREAVVAPSIPFDSTCVASKWAYQSNGESIRSAQQPVEDNSYISIERRNEPQNVGKPRSSTNTPLLVSRGRIQAPEHKLSKPDGLIVIPSDASSEETISDDRSNRP